MAKKTKNFKFNGFRFVCSVPLGRKLLALYLAIVGVFSALLIVEGDLETLTDVFSAPRFVGSVIICYAAIVVLMPLCYFARAKSASTAVGLK